MSSSLLDLEALRRSADSIMSLPKALKQTYTDQLPALERQSRARQLVGEISFGLFPTVAVLEVRQPYAADLLKRRLASMESQALQLSLLEVPDFEKPREPGTPVSEAAWQHATFLTYCYTFSGSVHAIAAEFAAEVGKTANQSGSEPTVKSPWYKQTAPPKGEYYETPLVGRLKELTAWNGLKKPPSLKLKVTKGVLWIMMEPNGRFACYFRTREQFMSAEARRVSAQTPRTKENQKRPKSHQPKNSRLRRS